MADERLSAPWRVKPHEYVLNLLPAEQRVVRVETSPPILPYNDLLSNLAWALHVRHPARLDLDLGFSPAALFPAGAPSIAYVVHHVKGEERGIREMLYNDVTGVKPEEVVEEFYQHLAEARAATKELSIAIGPFEATVYRAPKRDSRRLKTLF